MQLMTVVIVVKELCNKLDHICRNYCVNKSGLFFSGTWCYMKIVISVVLFARF